MEVFKTHLYLADDLALAEPYLVDTIFHKGAWWLVGSWIAQYATRERAPQRLVRLSGLSFDEVEGKPYRFQLHTPIPKSVLDGEAQAGYVLATNPVLSGSPEPNTKKPPRLQ
jgi:hypothetical protein